MVEESRFLQASYVFYAMRDGDKALGPTSPASPAAVAQFEVGELPAGGCRGSIYEIRNYPP